MRSILRKLCTLALAATLLPLPVCASEALGNDLVTRTSLLNSETILADGTFWSDTHSDLRQEYYISYAPSERVTPIVTYGETSRSLTTLSAAARSLEARGWRVVAGVNGDYYDTQYGLPIGSTMTEGVFRNLSGDRYYAVGFRSDGTAIIGDPQFSLRATVNGGSGFPIHAYNYLRLSDYGIFLYDHGFNSRHTTGANERGVDVVCSVTGGALTVGETLSLHVDEVLLDTADTLVPEGKYVLTANHKAAAYAGILSMIQPGDELTLSVASGAGNAGDWNGVTNLLGAPVLLVQNGAVVSGLATGSAPRTAIGQRADGTLIFYTIDGRRAGYSIGATLTAVAMRLIELGCVTAVALDGGGSTTIAATMPHETAAHVVNLPSDGSERAVSNHVFLVAPNRSSGQLDHVYLATPAGKALPGATLTLTAAAVDTNYLPMDTPVTLSSDGGTLRGNRITLPAKAGQVTVTAQCKGANAMSVIEAVEPEQIVVRNNATPVTALPVAPNSETTLTAQGVSDHLVLMGGDDCFSWSFAGNGVAFNAQTHTLRAGSGAGAGTLTISCGAKRIDIPVNVAVTPLKLLWDFEEPFSTLSIGEAAPRPGLTLSRWTGSANVRYGHASGRLAYVTDGVTPVTLPLSFEVSAPYHQLEMWICGDGIASLAFETDTGRTDEIVPPSGWQRLTFALPSGARRITGLYLQPGAAKTGVLWLDQLMLNYGKTDAAAPEVALAIDAATNMFTGYAFDALDGAMLTTLRLTLDGTALPYEFDKRTGALSAALPKTDGNAHRVTLTAGDAAGHLTRTTIELPASTTETAFPDTEKHWANASIAYLRRVGLSKGSDDGLYHPDANLTRQEFAVMLWRAFGDGVDYDDVELPFTDAGQIGGWAKDAVCAMYRLGVVNGDGNGAFRPAASVSRQEAAAMLGRLLEKGWAAPELVYPDSGAIASWAVEHVRTLSVLGIFGGYDDGAFHPAEPLTRAQIAAMLYRMN